MKLHDTIAAIATPIGSGGIAILRLSGSRAEEIITQVAAAPNGKPLPKLEDRKLTLCCIHCFGHPNALIDQALAVIMRAPRSYTGEDVAEIHCHGGFFAASKILTELLAAGARLAESGEFTRRAFLNGKTDLTGAEAVMDMIDSRSGLGLQNAARSLGGALAKKIDALREDLMAVTARISAAADYPEEIDPPAPGETAAALQSLQAKIQALLDGFETGRMLRDGILTVIIGRPNVGKSSLLNALSRSDRAIVTDIPGTTRDVIEEYIRIGGISLRLLDTAGIRSGAGEVEQIGIERALSHAREADLCLFVIDSAEGITEEDKKIAEQLKDKHFLLLLNKTDREARITPEEARQELGIALQNIIQTAAPKDGPVIGIDTLETAISRMFLSGHLNPGEVYLSNTRQRDALLKSRDAIARAAEADSADLPYDLLYVDLEDALSALGEITGVTVQEEIIDQVFSRFCVGK